MRAALLLLALAACRAADPGPADGRASIRVRAPLAEWRVIQGFVWNRGWGAYHLAEDAAADAGTEVMAAADGRVVLAEPASGYGSLVLVEHGTAEERYVTLYGHLSARRGLAVAAGQSVQEGELLGYIADDDEDGGDWGPHLHFGIRPGPADLSATICGEWLYVGYSRNCASMGHDRYRALWLDPAAALR
jgi:murein DD-endopeptidase MepM/ murein hydrolase activator NlpD